MWFLLGIPAGWLLRMMFAEKTPSTTVGGAQTAALNMHAPAQHKAQWWITVWRSDRNQPVGVPYTTEALARQYFATWKNDHRVLMMDLKNPHNVVVDHYSTVS